MTDRVQALPVEAVNDAAASLPCIGRRVIETAKQNEFAVDGVIQPEAGGAQTGRIGIVCGELCQTVTQFGAVREGKRMQERLNLRESRQPHVQRRDIGQGHLRLAQAQGFVGEKKVCAVASEWAAEDAAHILMAQRRAPKPR